MHTHETIKPHAGMEKREFKICIRKISSSTINCKDKGEKNRLHKNT